MKFIAILVGILFVLTIMTGIFSVSHISDAGQKCKAKGGVFFESRGSSLCLKKDALL